MEDLRDAMRLISCDKLTLYRVRSRSSRMGRGGHETRRRPRVGTSPGTLACPLSTKIMGSVPCSSPQMKRASSGILKVMPFRICPCLAFGGLVILTVVTCFTVYAQSTDHTATEEQPTTVIRTNTRMVQMSVVVQDKKGNPVSGLTKDDFTLLDTDVPQKIAFFAQEGGPRSPSTPKPPRRVSGRRFKSIFSSWLDVTTAVPTENVRRAWPLKSATFKKIKLGSR